MNTEQMKEKEIVVGSRVIVMGEIETVITRIENGRYYFSDGVKEWWETIGAIKPVKEQSLIQPEQDNKFSLVEEVKRTKQRLEEHRGIDWIDVSGKAYVPVSPTLKLCEHLLELEKQQPEQVEKVEGGKFYPISFYEAFCSRHGLDKNNTMIPRTFCVEMAKEAYKLAQSLNSDKEFTAEDMMIAYSRGQGDVCEASLSDDYTRPLVDATEWLTQYRESKGVK